MNMDCRLHCWRACSLGEAGLVSAGGGGLSQRGLRPPLGPHSLSPQSWQPGARSKVKPAWCQPVTMLPTCVCAFARLCVCCSCMCMCAFVHTSMRVACVYMRECACVFAWVCVGVCTSVCMCACTCVCVSPRCALLGSPCQPVPLPRCMGLTCLQQWEGPLLLVWEEEDVWKPGGAEMGRQVGGTPGLSPAHLGLPVQSPLCALTSHLPEQVALSHPGPQSCHQMSPSPPGSR